MGYYQRAVDDISRAILLDPGRTGSQTVDTLTWPKKTIRLPLRMLIFGIALNATYPVSYSVKALALQGLGRNTELWLPSTRPFPFTRQRPLLARERQDPGCAGDCTGAAAVLEKSREINPDYVLPYPGFGSAAEDLATLKTVCVTASAATPVAKSPLGWMAVPGAIGAVVATGGRTIIPYSEIRFF